MRIDDPQHFVEPALHLIAGLFAEAPETNRRPNPTRQLREIGAQAKRATGINESPELLPNRQPP